jgi:hypothetical protein
MFKNSVDKNSVKKRAQELQNGGPGEPKIDKKSEKVSSGRGAF